MTYKHEAALPGGALWNKVAKTYPSSTKQVNKGGGRVITAIDAYHQIKRATEVFGPVGQGWGWDITGVYYSGTTPCDLMTVAINIWWKTPLEGAEDNPLVGDEKFSYASIGCARLNMVPKNQNYTKTDDDVSKKALTDAITKGLSYLGFNADVFFGAFDDNKYVQAMREEEKGSAGATATPEPQAQPTGQEKSLPPAWFAELIGGEGRFADKTWEWMTTGGVDGGRHKYMHWMLENYRDPKALKRVGWILKKFYGDDTEPKA